MKKLLASRRFLRINTSVMEQEFLAIPHICFYRTLILILSVITYSFTNVNGIVSALIAKRQGTEVRNFISDEDYLYNAVLISAMQ